MLPLLNIGLRAARTASGQVIRAMERLDLIHAENNDLKHYLTKVCIGAETAAAYEIQKLYPQHQVIGSTTQTITGATEPSSHIWHINAIDGLNQYAHNLPLFALTLSCHEQGVLKHSIVLCPLTGEEFTASKGCGAQLNGCRIRASKHNTLRGAQLGTAYGTNQDTTVIHQCTAMQRYLMQQGSQIYLNMASAMTLAYVAAGRLDGCWLNLVATQSVLAGQLLAREAGALVGDFSGNSQTLKQHELVVASPKLFKLILQSIRRVRQDQSIQIEGTCMNQNNG